MRELERFLSLCVEADATDLHLSTGATPRLRVHGELRPIEGEGALDGELLERMARSLMNDRQAGTFRDKLALDLYYMKYRSTTMDLLILWHTVKTVVLFRGV